MKVGPSQGMCYSLWVNLEQSLFVCFWQWWTVLFASSSASPKTLWRTTLCVIVAVRLPQTRRTQIRYVLSRNPKEASGHGTSTFQTVFSCYKALGRLV